MTRIVPITFILLTVGSYSRAQLTEVQREQLVRQASELGRKSGNLFQAGRYFEALAPAREALAIRERLYPGMDHADIALSLNSLGHMLRATGDHDGALDHFRKALAMRERLYPLERYPDGHVDLAASFNSLAAQLQALGEYGEALTLYTKALRMRERLYPPDQYPDGHIDLATSLNNFGFIMQAMGEHAKALTYFEKALAMDLRLYPLEVPQEGHRHVAQAYSNVGYSLHALGEHGKALVQQEKALAIRERLFPPATYPNGHPDLAQSLNNLGYLLLANGENVKALPYYQRALDMVERLYPPERFKAGHPHLAQCLNNLAANLHALGEDRQALAYYEKAFAMRQRLYPPERFKNGHPEIGESLNNLGTLLLAMREYDKALVYSEQALAMYERLYPRERYPEGHPRLALAHANLAAVHVATDNHAKALPHMKSASWTYTRHAQRETASAPEAQALALVHSFPPIHLAFLNVARHIAEEPVADVYAVVWPSRGFLLDLLTRRHQAARADASPEAQAQWRRLMEVRGQQNRLAIEPGRDLAARQRRLAALVEEQERLERDLAATLPELPRRKHLAALGPKDLHARLEPGAAFIDIYRHGEARKARFIGYRYQAFVLAGGQEIQRIDLGPTPPIDEAIVAWRHSIDRRQESPAPAKLKQLVWDKLAAALPAGTKRVYLCPDGDLARVPWAALPGSKAGTVLLEDMALAVVPSGKWLLEQLLYPQAPDTSEASSAAVVAGVGAIDYGPAPNGATAAYGKLAETDRELRRVLEAFGTGERLQGSAATAAAVKQLLARARYAHLATHGYFDDAGVTAEQKRFNSWRTGASTRRGRPPASAFASIPWATSASP